ncbi:Arm DNA-binding domain-containing protein [Stenotrophomonas sp. AB1(2024)]|uniref:Arm DNA-binding domain-containing protein n=1 Tax=Stenotrophomonas sp. AB1(2024) TaxID=3132215 RepID=UPI0030B57E98
MVHPNGPRYWRWKYRVNGKEKLLGMGIYPEVSLAKAREAQEDARHLLASGVDPSEHRKAATASPPVRSRTTRMWLRRSVHGSGSTSRRRVWSCQ